MRYGALHLHEQVCLLVGPFAVDLEPQVLQADAAAQGFNELCGHDPVKCKPTQLHRTNLMAKQWVSRGMHGHSNV